LEASAGHGVCVLAHDLTGKCRRVVSCNDEIVLLNDDRYAFDCFADNHRYWLDTGALSDCPKLLAVLTAAADRSASPIKRISEVIVSRDNIVIAEPLAYERDWSVRCRQFVSNICETLHRSASAEIRQLATALCVVRAEQISL